ncbi:MAG: LPP20 family lipoprotein [Bdellovibrionales bacterium]|jgi:hypothetical protein|nr:LPP20 family lipoprotein [Bdellovibrionales bacterium]MBT3527314.1 LPP20 family lipoprotein [Bdellovibrionales bacterium]MBT7669321.1 LPP20 family lipoprotein [Bdellovibrionales bacterium]MBT7766108.1 LPP20 family lipoprotein [Bdellovibrionales bacterium]
MDARIMLFAVILFLLGWGSDRSVAGTPEWMNNTDKVCKRHQLCAVGEGDSFNLASANARKGIAQIFKTRIKSKFEASTSISGDKVDEDLSSHLEEITDEVLEGVEVIKSYDSGTSYFALAMLNKSKAARRYKKELDRIDSKISGYGKEKKGRSLHLLKKLFFERDVVHSRYEFLTGRTVAPPMSFMAIEREVRKGISSYRLSLKMTGEQSGLIGPVVLEALSAFGYKMVSGESAAKATHSVLANYTSKALHMKVKGFLKYQYMITVTVTDRNGVKIGALEHLVIAVGRNIDQANQKGGEMIRSYLLENIASLNIE